MGSERIVLRFRDTTPHVNTISEHENLIRKQGAVWWGWWRKHFEPDHRSLLESLSAGDSSGGCLFIIDRSTRRLFSASYLQVAVRSSDVDDARIPEYYRGQRDRVAAWFLLQSIASAKYDERIDSLIGDYTFLDLLDSNIRRDLIVKRRSAKRSILHLSDLHFGADYGFLLRRDDISIGEKRNTLTQSLDEDLRRIHAKDDIGLVVITGDLTTKGDWSDRTRGDILHEFGELTKALSLSKEDVVCLPGNHDIVRYPENATIDVGVRSVENQTTMQHEREYRTFLEELTGRHWRSSLNYIHRVQLAERFVTLCILNSCTITATQWTEYGYVGASGIDILKQLSSADEPASSIKIVALHHHVVPVASIEAPNAKGVSLTLDSVALLDAALDNGADMIIHGHQHQARITTYGRLPMNGDQKTGNIVVVSGGSSGATAQRLPGSERNTYSLIRMSPDEVSLTMRELRPDARAGAILYDGKLPLSLH